MNMQKVYFEIDGITFIGEADSYDLNISHGDEQVSVSNVSVALVPRDRLGMAL